MLQGMFAQGKGAKSAGKPAVEEKPGDKPECAKVDDCAKLECENECVPGEAENVDTPAPVESQVTSVGTAPPQQSGNAETVSTTLPNDFTSATLAQLNDTIRMNPSIHTGDGCSNTNEGTPVTSEAGAGEGSPQESDELDQSADPADSRESEESKGVEDSEGKGEGGAETDPKRKKSAADLAYEQQQELLREPAQATQQQVDFMAALQLLGRSPGAPGQPIQPIQPFQTPLNPLAQPVQQQSAHIDAVKQLQANQLLLAQLNPVYKQQLINQQMNLLLQQQLMRTQQNNFQQPRVGKGMGMPGLMQNNGKNQSLVMPNGVQTAGPQSLVMPNGVQTAGQSLVMPNGQVQQVQTAGPQSLVMPNGQIIVNPLLSSPMNANPVMKRPSETKPPLPPVVNTEEEEKRKSANKCMSLYFDTVTVTTKTFFKTLKT